MGAALPVIAIAAQAAGTIYSGIEANNGARAAAAVDQENARRTILSGEYDALQTRKDERRLSGDLIASMGAAGVDIGSGSSADIIRQNAVQRELEILNIRSRATNEANNLYQAAADKKKAGRSALIQSMFGAVSGALAGASDMRAQRTSGDIAARVGDAMGRKGSGTWNTGSGAHSPYETPPYVPPMRVKG
ncbi:hypothetical protein [Stakelama pacifica]|uniref:Uncharacterized protein n=1 Tax=Stakelama pacifica TaxID=517720 RepID=A0A4R6FMZ7_9SPHN|nr:hypothetical protein [Stakelama pacifica]TDN82971.1 hypothetical protein EV664_105169 [Stakelama pacifica]